MHGQDALISNFPTEKVQWPLWSRLKIAFVILIVLELIVGFTVLRSTNTDGSMANQILTFSGETTANILFTLIIIGTIVGSALFLTLGRFVIRSRSLLNQMNDGICITNKDWKILTFNNAFSSITGFSPKQISKKTSTQILPGCKTHAHAKLGDRWECEYEGHRPDGTHYCANVSVFVMATENGAPTNCLITLRDITEIKKSQAHIHDMAYKDGLTGLANRSQLLLHLTGSIEQAEKNNTKFGLIYLDLDGFKDINDSLGHDAGDEVLREMGVRLGKVTRKYDLIARLGGDEFCIVLENVENESTATFIANRCLEEISQPMEVCGRTLRPQTSIGIAIFPGDAKSKEMILQAADTAMYAAKKSGKHRFSFYTPELTEAAERKLALEHDLREALEKKQFELYYQPQISLLTQQIVGAEALIRWNHPERGLVPPDEFINIAEEIGMIDQLGEWVIETACHQASLWSDFGLPEFNISVNISGSHFRSPKLVSTVSNALSDSGLDASRLELEVTEGVMQTSEESIEVFKRIKQLGVSIAIDDFGTGFSSLSSLKKLPLDCLKLDREFVHDMLDKSENSVIIATIIGMGQALGLKIIAEGVETLNHIYYLKGLNCNIMQGYFFSPPVPAEKFPALLEKDFLATENHQNQSLTQQGM